MPKYHKLLNEVQSNVKATNHKNLEEYKQDFIDMNIGSLKSILTNAQSILDSLSDPDVKKNLTASWLQGKIAVTEEYMKTIHDYVKFAPVDDDKSVAGCGCGQNAKKVKPRPVPPKEPKESETKKE